MTEMTSHPITAPAASGDRAFLLEGRHALVTGGASGIGEATVKELARAGAVVWIADVNLAAAQALAGTVPSARAIALDVTSSESVAEVARRLDRLDILVNYAGVGHVGTLEATEPEDFDRLFNVNVRGVYLVTRAMMPLLLAVAAGGERVGVIVNMGSTAGQFGVKQRFAYCGTKGAVLAMTRQLAVDYPKTLRVSAVCPGTTQTPFVEAYLEKFHKNNKEETRAELRARQPMGRLGQPEEIASMVRYLASDEAAFITGALMMIDGGLTAI